MFEATLLVMVNPRVLDSAKQHVDHRRGQGAVCNLRFFQQQQLIPCQKPETDIPAETDRSRVLNRMNSLKWNQCDSVMEQLLLYTPVQTVRGWHKSQLPIWFTMILSILRVIAREFLIHRLPCSPRNISGRHWAWTEKSMLLWVPTSVHCCKACDP